MTLIQFTQKKKREKRGKAVIKKVAPLPYTGSGCEGYGIELI